MSREEWIYPPLGGLLLGIPAALLVYGSVPIGWAVTLTILATCVGLLLGEALAVART